MENTFFAWVQDNPDAWPTDRGKWFWYDARLDLLGNADAGPFDTREEAERLGPLILQRQCEFALDFGNDTNEREIISRLVAEEQTKQEED